MEIYVYTDVKKNLITLFWKSISNKVVDSDVTSDMLHNVIWH